MMQLVELGFAERNSSFAFIADLARKGLAAIQCLAGRSSSDVNRSIAVPPRARMIIPRGSDFRPEAMKGVSFNEIRLTA